MNKTLFLICNAHLDPVWLWEWEEGLAETQSTFRTAVKLCEEFEGFAFCHNEALLYKWIEEYEPELFSKIQELVKEDKWYIIGGWYVQSDCNIPSGESFVRQILYGKKYFMEKFNVEPKTAINFDPFGHTRGLVQILKKSGYTSYLFCRPDKNWLNLPDDDFIWVGYDGSEILAHRAIEHYNSEKGKAKEKIVKWINENKEQETGILLWGIGNHGGGASREDLTNIEILQKEGKEWNIVHGKPEDYFNWLEIKKENLPRFKKDLNPWAVGCYTSMAKVKQKHRQLENMYYSTEKMLTNAYLQGLIEYPKKELNEALEDMLFCEFHDILPGSSVSEVENYALQRMGQGLEILSRLRAKAFFSLLSGEEPAKEGEFPIFIYNPHPFDIEETIISEFQPPEPNLNKDIFLMPELYDSEGYNVPFQLEKESCNIQVDQRKRIVFKATLKASSMNRFPCYLRKIYKISKLQDLKDEYRFDNGICEVVINKQTGLIDKYKINGIDYLKNNSFQPLVIKDSADPWGMKVLSFREVIGEFSLMTKKESGEFAGVSAQEFEPVRIIEDGEIRTIVEALFKYNHSSICMRYKIPKHGSEIEIEARVYWQEKDKMLKLSVPTNFEDGKCRGEVAYGVEEFENDGNEKIAQKWLGIASYDKNYALTIINDRTYGFDFKDGELRLSLLRSPAYSGHPVDDVTPIIRQDRFEPRIDQGERIFKFWLNAGDYKERFSGIGREAFVKNEFPMVLCCYPSGFGKKVIQGVILSDKAIQLTTLKLAEDNDNIIIRLFNPTDNERKTEVKIPCLNMKIDILLTPFELKTIAIDIRTKEFHEVDLLERK